MVGGQQASSTGGGQLQSSAGVQVVTHMKKIRGHIEYPKELAFQQGHAKYKLKGVVVHWGTLEHGHYVSVV